MTEEQAIEVLYMIKAHGGLAFKAKEIAIKNIRNMKEIKKIMECDTDAETKCKMISNILTVKPHYFKEQESQKGSK